jgi:hypothetical protein
VHKLTFKAFIIPVLVILAVFVGLFINTLIKQTQYDDTAIPYIKKVVPQISQWDLNTAKPLFAQLTLDNMSDETLSKALEWFSPLGALKTMDAPQFMNTNSITEGEGTGQEIIIYLVTAQYEHDEAQITLKLLETDPGYEIYNINISPKTLYLIEE